MSHVGHGRVLCSCGRVIAQCRCMGNVRILDVQPHPACGFPEPQRQPPTAAELDDLAGVVLRHVSAYPQAHVAMAELATIVRLLEYVDEQGPGHRLVIGLDDGGEAFACVDRPPPDDHGPLVETPTTLREAIRQLAAMVEPS